MGSAAEGKLSGQTDFVNKVSVNKVNNSVNKVKR